MNDRSSGRLRVRSKDAGRQKLAEDECAACEELPGPYAPQQLTPEFLDHDGLARQLSCSVTTVHKLRREHVLGEPCQIGSLVRWHWPTVRERILAQAAAPQISTSDPFLEGLNGPR